MSNEFQTDTDIAQAIAAVIAGCGEGIIYRNTVVYAPTNRPEGSITFVMSDERVARDFRNMMNHLLNNALRVVRVEKV